MCRNVTNWTEDPWKPHIQLTEAKRVPHPQVRPLDPSALASADRLHAGPYPGLLPCLCADAAARRAVLILCEDEPFVAVGGYLVAFLAVGWGAP